MAQKLDVYSREESKTAQLIASMCLATLRNYMALASASFQADVSQYRHLVCLNSTSAFSVLSMDSSIMPTAAEQLGSGYPPTELT